MTPSWKEIGHYLGFILLFGIIAYNLYVGAAIGISLFRGVVAFLVYGILNILITNVIVKLISDFEFRRLKKFSEMEEEAEQQLGGKEGREDPE